MRRALGFVLLILVGACVSPGTREPDRYFILDAAPGSKAAAAVRLAPASADTFYDTQDIVYSRAPGTRAYYHFNHWTERPQRALHKALAARFEENSPGPVLNTHLEEIYHDAVARPGSARISITAELLDPASRSVIARRRFTQSAPAASYDAPGAVQGFREALRALLDEMVRWVDAEARR
jgi:ABC-type uncharacterized transport system auxiliary subunit